MHGPPPGSGLQDSIKEWPFFADSEWMNRHLPGLSTLPPSILAKHPSTNPYYSVLDKHSEPLLLTFIAYASTSAYPDICKFQPTFNLLHHPEHGFYSKRDIKRLRAQIAASVIHPAQHPRVSSHIYDLSAEALNTVVNLQTLIHNSFPTSQSVKVTGSFTGEQGGIDHPLFIFQSQPFLDYRALEDSIPSGVTVKRTDSISQDRHAIATQLALNAGLQPATLEWLEDLDVSGFTYWAETVKRLNARNAVFVNPNNTNMKDHNGDIISPLSLHHELLQGAYVLVTVEPRVFDIQPSPQSPPFATHTRTFHLSLRELDILAFDPDRPQDLLLDIASHLRRYTASYAEAHRDDAHTSRSLMRPITPPPSHSPTAITSTSNLTPQKRVKRERSEALSPSSPSHAKAGPSTGTKSNSELASPTKRPKKTGKTAPKDKTDTSTSTKKTDDNEDQMSTDD